MEYRDYYATLGVDKGASQADIKKAFRRLARENHPDVNKGDAAAEKRFKEISEANEVLSDPDKRKAYDQLGVNWGAYQQAGGNGGGGPFAGFGGAGPGGGGALAGAAMRLTAGAAATRKPTRIVLIKGSKPCLCMSSSSSFSGNCRRLRCHSESLAANVPDRPAEGMGRRQAPQTGR